VCIYTCEGREDVYLHEGREDMYMECMYHACVTGEYIYTYNINIYIYIYIYIYTYIHEGRIHTCIILRDVNGTGGGRWAMCMGRANAEEGKKECHGKTEGREEERKGGLEGGRKEGRVFNEVNEVRRSRKKRR
jgi:hypothetical protein